MLAVIRTNIHNLPLDGAQKEERCNIKRGKKTRTNSYWVGNGFRLDSFVRLQPRGEKITPLPLYITHINWMSVYKNEENIQLVFCIYYYYYSLLTVLCKRTTSELTNRFLRSRIDEVIAHGPMREEKKINMHLSYINKTFCVFKLSYFFIFFMWSCILLIDLWRFVKTAKSKKWDLFNVSGVSPRLQIRVCEQTETLAYVFSFFEIPVISHEQDLLKIF